MIVLSLFDGISCARVALERAGIPVEVYFASEIDDYAISISGKNYPDIIQIGDVKTILDWARATDIPIELSRIREIFGIDLLIGGSPCQDLSIAKKDRKGLDGERSSLFWEYVRILREIKPKYFILENVASMPKEAKEIITRELGVEPIMINAALVSAQNRKRLFWTNIPDVIQPEDRGILLKDILESGEVCHKTTIALTETRTEEAKRIRRESMRSGCDFCPRREKELVPRTDGKSNTITTGQTKESLVLISPVAPVALRNRGQGKKPEYNGTEKANALTTVQTDSMVEQDFIIRKLTPIECERLQGLPDNYTEGISNTQRYKCLGNAFNVDVVSHILSFIKK